MGKYDTDDPNAFPLGAALCSICRRVSSRLICKLCSQGKTQVT